MSTLTLDLFLEEPPGVGDTPPAGGERRPEGAAQPGHEAPAAAAARGRRTLDDVIVGVWEDLLAHHAAACPVCGDQMHPRYGSGPAPVGGRCGSCGSTLG